MSVGAQAQAQESGDCDEHDVAADDCPFFHLVSPVQVLQILQIQIQ